MAVFVDDAAIVYRGKPRYHLMADSLEELHAFAQAAGIHRCWFHNTRNYPHYDITGEQRQVALAVGAQPLSSRDMVRRFRNKGAVSTKP